MNKESFYLRKTWNWERKSIIWPKILSRKKSSDSSEKHFRINLSRSVNGSLNIFDGNPLLVIHGSLISGLGYPGNLCPSRCRHLGSHRFRGEKCDQICWNLWPDLVTFWNLVTMFQVRFESIWFLPPDSYLRQYFDAMEEYFPSDGKNKF